MKLRTLFLIVAVTALAGCQFQNKVVEEKWPDGSPKKVCIYMGKGEGRILLRETTYYENKQMQMDGTYRDNKREGKWTYWYENGKVWSEGTFINGKSDGKRVTYFENGNIRYEGNYKNDMRVGRWRFFDETGRMLREVDYSAPGGAVQEPIRPDSVK